MFNLIAGKPNQHPGQPDTQQANEAFTAFRHTAASEQGPQDPSKIKPGQFPELDFTTRPAWNQYVAIKAKLVDEAMAAAQPYLDFVFSFDQVADNEDICKAITHVVREFITYFWNMPSSLDYHHKEPWGHLVHSLETACMEAQLMSKQVLFNASGMDSERMLKQKGFMVLAGFLLGLFHDAAKILNLDLTHHSGSGTTYYEPFRGSVLNFLLIHPHGTTSGWKPISGQHLPWNLLFFLHMVPIEIFKAMPHDLLMVMLERLLKYESLQGDMNSVRKWVRESDFMKVLCKALGEWAIQDHTLFNVPKLSPLYKVDGNWYLALHPKFLLELARKVRLDEPTLSEILRENGVLGCNEAQKYYCNAKVYLDPESQMSADLNVCFLSAALIDNVLETACQNDNIQPCGLLIDPSSKQSVESIMKNSDPRLKPELFMKPEAKKQDKQKKKKNDATIDEENAYIAADVKSTAIISSDELESDVSQPSSETIKNDKKKKKRTKGNELTRGKVEESMREEKHIKITSENINQQVLKGEKCSPNKSEEQAEVESQNEITNNGQEEEKDFGFPEADVELMVKKVLIGIENKTYNLQRKDRCFCYFSIDNKLYFKFPSFMDYLFGFSKEESRFEKSKNLKAKLLSRMVYLGYFEKQSDENYVQKNISFVSVSQKENTLEVDSVKGLFILANINKFVSLNDGFKKMVMNILDLNMVYKENCNYE